jgi:hypothetical protein
MTETNQTTPYTIAEFCKMITNNAKSNQWVNCTVPVEYATNTGEMRIFKVGIKAFGLWVQILQINGLTSSIPEQKTQKALKAALTEELNLIMRVQA